MGEDRFEANWPAFLAIGVGVLALFLSIFALGRAMASPLDDGRLAEAVPISGDGGNVGVELNEFAINPADLDAVAGATIGVTNTGAVVHNLAIVDTDVATRDLNAGESVDLDVADLEPGTYTWICTIEGHEAAGMTGALTVADGAGRTSTVSDVGTEMDHGDDGAAAAMPTSADMEQAMADSIGAFPAETEGRVPRRSSPRCSPTAPSCMS